MKAVFLDAGLTLLRADPSLGGVYARVTRGFGREVPPGEFERAAEGAFHALAKEHRDLGEEGLATSESLERESWVRHARRVHGAVAAMAEVPFDPWFDRLYDEFGSPAAWKPYDDAVPALERLRARGMRLAVVSNWDSRLHGILEAGGLRPWFEEVFVSSEIGWRKPHPGIFRHALRTMGLGPAEVLHVGDSAGDDVRGAAGCGIRAALLDRAGTRAGEGLPSVRSLRDLEGWLPPA